MPDDPRKEVACIAMQMLSGSIELFDGCRRIARLRGQLGAEDDDALTIILGIDSEIDDLPNGDERANWDPIALREKDRQRFEYMAKVEPQLRSALESLIANID